MMTSPILKSVDFKKTQTFENKTLIFLQIKRFTNYTSQATLWQKKKKKSFVAETTFNLKF